ncbi:uncharacterized protein Z520_02341 [Fonsecaea multimorphosa CBS 102226]|uniref:Uncharacterized protein n=1 Tax=Fonsecaea multimorphosa CBS 102226 TaxID=1442371 RepID=A0A0D2K7Z0_9EURO|nr:uncharacterized protein Z520_02341 [Fonsecaea multimorphosa CBS 102226]KIY02203.1 hypothetical protein Z520_02341 [Fonsecaea multimorphosa CBS 102226]OAL29395.1 hypothetical protein AYO22_02289 [Fonsecaea multimorphosa]
MSDLTETKSPVPGKSSEPEATEPDTTHKPPQSAPDGTENDIPPRPEILRSLSNKEFTAWREYLGDREKPKDYINWKLKMIGESQQATTNQSAGIQHQHAAGEPGIGEPSSSGSSSRLQEEMPKRTEKHDETLETKAKQDVLEGKEDE